MADLVLHNGIVHTLEADHPTVDAIAVRGDRIVALGAEALALRGDDTRAIDLGGRAVLPGLHDAHAHFIGLGKTLQNLDLKGTTSAEQVREKVLAACAGAAPGEWIYGRGWDQNDWEGTQFPSWKDLQGCGDNPVYLSRVDGHALWVNDVALKLAGIHKGTADPDGGRILRDDLGIPTGVLVDNAETLVLDLVPAATHDQLVERALLAQDECLRLGLTSVTDAGVDAAGFAVYEELGSTGRLKVRIHAMVQGEAELIEQQLALGPRAGLHDHHLSVRAIKLYADGALGSRGAALLAPYSDEPGHSGLVVTDPAEIHDVSLRALRRGFQVCTHAIGDRGNRVTLDAYARALDDLRAETGAVPDHRFRVEHAQVLHLDDIPRFAELGVLPSMQPTHATSDMPWAGDRVGPERLAGAYAWRRLLDTGTRLPLGSDFPVESPAPLWGIYAAVTRQDHAGQPDGGWLPDQRLTVEEAVRGFTVDAAYGSFEEDLKGTLAVGKLADLVVLSRDIFAAPPAEILETEVQMTVVGGAVAFGALE
jgi:predicted amidohydrolase YtcJ